MVFMVKSIEPLSTAVLAIPVLKQRFNLRLLLAILVAPWLSGPLPRGREACSGIMITAAAAHGGYRQLSASNAYFSMALGMMANVGFSSRACVAKRALAFESKEPLEAPLCLAKARERAIGLWQAEPRRHPERQRAAAPVALPGPQPHAV